MKSVLVFVAAFVVAAAASTGAKRMMTERGAMPPATVDSANPAAAGDSSGTDTNYMGSSVPGQTVNAAIHDSSATDAAPMALTNATTDAAVRPTSGAATTATAATHPDTAVEASERRLARVFASMDAKQAARVLEHMADTDAEVILSYVGTRQAASIMAELPPERVATLSKMAIKDAQSGGRR